MPTDPTAAHRACSSYSSGEDYRWKEIRSWPGFGTFAGWEAFNLLFICGFQQLIILAFTSPAAAAMAGHSSAPLNALDLFAAGLHVTLVVTEATADAQMLKFQTEKYRRINKRIPLGPDYQHGFIRTGLWAYSRHPNCAPPAAAWPPPARCGRAAARRR